MGSILDVKSSIRFPAQCSTGSVWRGYYCTCVLCKCMPDGRCRPDAAAAAAAAAGTCAGEGSSSGMIKKKEEAL